MLQAGSDNDRQRLNQQLQRGRCAQRKDHLSELDQKERGDGGGDDAPLAAGKWRSSNDNDRDA